MLLGAWWDLLLGRSEEFDSALEAKLRTTKADVITECEGFVSVLSAFVLEGLLSCFEVGEEVTKFLFWILKVWIKFQLKKIMLCDNYDKLSSTNILHFKK